MCIVCKLFGLKLHEAKSYTEKTRLYSELLYWQLNNCPENKVKDKAKAKRGKNATKKRS